MPSKKARLKDIATLAGVSIGTVDRVLHQRGEVSEKTRAKVQKIIDETNYSPNVMAQVLKSKKRYHIVSLLPEATSDNLFWLKHPMGMAWAMEELDPFPITLSQITFDILNEEDFQKKAAEVLKLKPDGVLLAPIFKSESSLFCSQLENVGIPFVFIDGLVEKTGFLAYVGENTFQSGRVAGQLIDMVTPPGADVLIVTIAKNIKNVHHLSKRSEGFMTFFNGTGLNFGEKIVVSIPEPTIESVKTTLDNIFEKHPLVGSIFITGSRSYLIAGYLKKRGITAVNLIGYDLIDPNVKYLKSGTICFLISQRPEEQAYRGIRKLFDYLYLRKIPEKIEYLPVDIVASENVDFFIK
jgi:LacI family transcriptional regulator